MGLTPLDRKAWARRFEQSFIADDTRRPFRYNVPMPSAEKLTEFVAWVRQHLTGDEKGEAQLFLDRLFQAFGHGGVKEAGATLSCCRRSPTTQTRPRLGLRGRSRAQSPLFGGAVRATGGTAIGLT